jgi:putative SOS response-associated peptidase YedK
MCGRYASSRTRSDLLETFKMEEALADEEKAPDYNVTPTKASPTVLSSHPRGAGADAEPQRQVAEPEVGAGAVVGKGSEDREPDSLY